ncbi:hypothetical protein PIB30_031434 [Stylosanthes scabra]|uniref:Serine-threonine/tyrosine-protein kinase catalytic domain-containing protein n=1 Tax=Stylosanthes scabra TaxID=79078 RepID=A0ABU6RC26_9FABA|nr:hypothetical protein [Stylosanthes scabra]
MPLYRRRHVAGFLAHRSPQPASSSFSGAIYVPSLLQKLITQQHRSPSPCLVEKLRRNRRYTKLSSPHCACLVMGDFDFTIDVHHGGRFIDMGHSLEYSGGFVLEDLYFELDSWSLQEIVTIGKTHHKNLVRLLGFCAEGPKRLLVYEYMSNGSLGKLLFGNEMLPYWDLIENSNTVQGPD